MGNTALGVGAFGAGLAKSLAGAYASKREREREDARRKEDRAYEVEKFKFSTMLPSMLENIEDVDDDVLATEFPTIFGGKQKAGVGKVRGAIGAALQNQPTDTLTGMTPSAPPTAGANGKVVFSDADTGAAIGEAPAIPRRTLMGVPISTPEEKIERGVSKMETETTAKVALARRMLPQLQQADPTATMDDALAVVGIRTPSATARASSASMQAVHGTDAQGNEVNGVFDRSKGAYVYPVGHAQAGQPIAGFVQTTTARQQFGVDREAIAQGLFGVAFGKATQPQKEIVLREEKRMLQEEASARTLGGAQGKFTAPMTAKEAQDIPGATPGTTSAQLAGQTVPTLQQAERRKSVEQLKLTLQDIVDTKLKALPKQSELQGLAPGAAYALRRRLPQYRNDIAALESAINNVVNVMARSVGEQRGTQTERDALRAEAAIAQIRDAFLTGDTQESAKIRITESLAVLDRILLQLPQSVVPQAVPGAPGVQPQTGAPTVVPVQPAGQPGTAPPTRRRLVQDPTTGAWVAP